MRIPGYCIKNPVTALVINLAILLLGIAALFTLEVRGSPPHEVMMIHIQSNFTGASGQLMEENVTDVLEDKLTGIQGIERTTSTSSQGQSSIKLKLLPGVDRNEVMSEVRAKVSQAMGNLPSGMSMPVVETFTDDDGVLNFIAYWPGHSLEEVNDYSLLTIKPALASVPGVGILNVGGVGERVMSITLNPSLMAARGVSVDQVRQAIQVSNLSLPAGQIKSLWMDFPATLNTRLSTPAEFGSVLVRKNASQSVHVRDVADVKLGQSSGFSQRIAYNGMPVIFIGVGNEDGASLIDTYKNVMKKYAQILTKVPENFKLVAFWDNVESLIDSIHEVFFSIFFAILCVLIVVFLCLGRLRQVWVPAIAIPISLFGALFIMKCSGVSINIFTLLALVVAVGLVVDDAIVILENTTRHLHLGRSRREAAIIGGNEIAAPVMIMTLTLLIVYFPISFVSGRYAAIYLQFAVTLSAAVLVSGVVSLTLSPLMCAYTLPTNVSRFQGMVERVLTAMSSRYRRALSWILSHSVWVLIPLLMCVGAGVYLIKVIPHEVAPEEERGFFMVMPSMPTGANTQAVEAKNKEVSKVIHALYPKADIGSIAGNNGQSGSGMLFVMGKDRASATTTFKKDLPSIQAALNKIPGDPIRAVIPNQFQNSTHAPIDFYITSSDSFEKLSSISKKIEKKLSTIPGIVSPRSTLLFNSQQYDIHVNTQLANDLGITNQQINSALNATFGEDRVSDFIYKSQLFHVVLRAPTSFRNSMSSIDKIQLSNAQGGLVPLSQLVKIKSVLKQSTLAHVDRMRAAEMTAMLKPGVPLSEVAESLKQNLPSWLPEGVGYQFSGQLKQLNDASGNMTLIFVMSILCIYFALSIQFKNFLDPLAILLTVPLCIVGALTALWATGGSINLYTTIALVTLVGLITKHGILIVQFANQRLEETGSITEAVLMAAEVRLRPILMTTAAMVVGALPLVFASGAGAASRHQIGFALVGGLVIGTFFSLIVVPIAYRLLARFRLTGYER